MTANFQRITPFLWFDTQAEEAAHFYTSIFPNSRILDSARYDKASAAASGRPEGSVMVINFLLEGQEVAALNGGPIFKFTEALSLVINCKTQQEIDHYWNQLGAGGDPAAQQCGWLKDKFGVSWQVVPTILAKLMSDPDKAKSGRTSAAMMQMKKLDIAALQKAYNG